MMDLIFRIHREPYVPNPCYRDAKAAKEKISSLGGKFYRFSINEWTSTTDLEKYLVEQYGLSESAVSDALEAMAETTIPELVPKLRDLWGVVECTGGLESTTFAGYAFTGKELEAKTKLFIVGVHHLKEHLQKTIIKKGSSLSAKVSWEI